MAGSQHTTLQQFHAYDFDSDKPYQDGLQGMISSGVLEGKTEAEKKTWLLQTRVFYYNHVNNTGLTIEEVQAAGANNATASEHSDTSNAPSSLQEPTSSIPDSKVEPRTLSFAELKELIEQGKTDQIPNNRVIPHDLSDATPSESKAAVRKKPWEV
ncbi:hypothetical protein BC629DRAFT_1586932 [Irpex lacteus]|nr:hypothetical protein BC629DRAFT_1586932 [Irpex lacteus]